MPASAEEVAPWESADYIISVAYSAVCGSSSYYGTLPLYPNDGASQFTTEYVTNFGAANQTFTYNNTFSFFSNDGEPFIKKGGEVTLTFYNVYMSSKVEVDGGAWTSNTIGSARLLLFYNDGTMEYVDGLEIVPHSPLNDITATFTPTKDISSYELILTQTRTPYKTYSKVTMYIGEYDDNGIRIDMKQESEETGLLKSIVNWFSRLWDSIVEIPNKIWEKFSSAFDGITNWLSDLWQSITELPAKIWGFIEDGLKALFVPDEEYISQYKDNFDSMLSTKLGAVYQVVNLTFDSFDRITETDETNTIELPETTIDLPDNNTFSFGGFDIQVVPTGFEFIVEIVKMIVGIVCTVLFINGLRKRYDEVMGVEQ